MRFKFILAEKGNHSVTALCRVMQVAMSGYYAWVHRPESARAKADHLLRAKVRVSHATSRRMYVNPALGQGKPAAPDAQYTIGGGTIPSTLYLVNDGGFTTDELRVATTWEDAAPTTLGACCVNSTLCLSLNQSDCAQVPGARSGRGG